MKHVDMYIPNHAFGFSPNERIELANAEVMFMSYHQIIDSVGLELIHKLVELVAFIGGILNPY